MCEQMVRNIGVVGAKYIARSQSTTVCFATDQRGDGAPDHSEAAPEHQSEHHRCPYRGGHAPDHHTSRFVVPKFAQIHQ